MKKNKMKRIYKMGGTKKKYALGGTAINMQTPAEILQNFQLNSQQAKAESMLGPSQDLRNIAGITGALGSNLTSKGLSSISPDVGGVTGFLKNNEGLLQDIQNLGLSNSFANGGTVNSETDPKKKGKENIQKTKEEYGLKINPFPKKSHKYRALQDFRKIGDTRQALPFEVEALLKIIGNDPRFNADEVLFANGGSVGNTPIEAEGKEVIETPDGMVAEIVGPSHEQGGVNMNLPEGTDIYSKRLKGPDGKSMAERKKKRERSIKSLEKLLENNPTDKILKKTLKTVKENNEFVDKQDVNTMNLFKSLEEAVQKYQVGGTVGPIFGRGLKSKFEPLLEQYQQFDPSFDINNIDSRKLLQRNLGLTDDGIFGKKTLSGLSNFDFSRRPQATTASSISPNEFDALNETPSLATPGIVAENNQGSGIEDILNNIFGEIKGSGVTPGDVVGIAGRLQSANQGVDLVNQQRAGDTPNINPFKDFGTDALKTIEQSKGFLATQRDLSLKGADESRADLVRRGRSSARSVGTQRALDLAASRQADKAFTDIQGNFAQQFLGILETEAGLENTRDLRRAQGEQARDLADRQDRDNYFTQLSKALNQKALGTQYLGRDLNQITSRNVSNNLINQLSKYGLKLDNQGNLITN